MFSVVHSSFLKIIFFSNNWFQLNESWPNIWCKGVDCGGFNWRWKIMCRWSGSALFNLVIQARSNTTNPLIMVTGNLRLANRKTHLIPGYSSLIYLLYYSLTPSWLFDRPSNCEYSTAVKTYLSFNRIPHFLRGINLNGSLAFAQRIHRI